MIKKRLIPCTLLSILGALLLPSCQALANLPLKGQQRFPVYFDPAYAFQIYSREETPFPFSPGDRVEMAGLLVLHTLPNAAVSDRLPGLTWYASTYPYGDPVSDEALRLTLIGQETGESYPLTWAVDNDDVLLVLSDTRIPRALFPNRQAGDSHQVCLVLEVGAVQRHTEGSDGYILLPLHPIGTEAGGLVRSEIWLCGGGTVLE